MGSAETPDDDRRPGTSWSSRPFLSRTLRVALFIIPVLASFAVAVLLERLLPRATSTATTALWVGVIAAGSLATLVALERAGRRLMPLAALLNLALIFPDSARTLRRGTTKRQPTELQANLQRAHDAGHADEAQRMRGVIELVLALSVHDRASRRTLGTRASVHRPSRRRTQDPRGRTQSSALGRPPPRHRQARGVRDHPQQTQQAEP